jgi:predicted AlkP superfamily pyrophosphatase or phosphodiesterase
MAFKKILLPIVFLVFSFGIKAQDTIQQVVKNRINSIAQQKKSYVILISVDGFRWDFADKYGAKNLQQFRGQGVQADYLIPSFPSLTFPNHYSIVTGLYPAHHGIVENNFYDKNRNEFYKKSNKKIALDSSWYNGKPLWLLAEQQQMLSAVFYWPGSEIAIENIRPTYFYNYNEDIGIDKRIDIIKKWLELPEEKRPHFIALYFPQVDQAAHKYSAEADETKQAVKIVDEAIAKLVNVAKNTGLAINFVFVSDHGMTSVDTKNTISLPSFIDKNKFFIPPGNALINIYAKADIDILPTYRALKKDAKNYDVFLKKNLPKSWHYNAKNDFYKRIGDIVLIPHLPFVFNINDVEPSIGQHGFDPKIKDMHATFYAWGPQLKSGLKIPAFENVNIYPFIAKLLGLNYTHQIDGRGKVLTPVLK